MKKKLQALLFSLATLVLTSCGGGNETSSNSASIVGQATFAETAIACNASSTYGNEIGGPLLTATTNPTLGACIAAMPGIAYGNPWTPWQNSGCLESPSMRFFMGNGGGEYGGYVGRGPNISQSAVKFCVDYANTCCLDPSSCSGQPAGSQEALNSFCTLNGPNAS
jgi:hypothetical protein